MGALFPFDRCTEIHERGIYFTLTLQGEFKQNVLFIYKRSSNSNVYLFVSFAFFKVLGFNIAQAGVLASLPYLARLFCGFVFGTIGDSLTKAEVMAVTTIRKSFCLFCKSIF